MDEARRSGGLVSSGEEFTSLVTAAFSFPQQEGDARHLGLLLAAHGGGVQRLRQKECSGSFLLIVRLFGSFLFKKEETDGEEHNWCKAAKCWEMERVWGEDGVHVWYFRSSEVCHVKIKTKSPSLQGDFFDGGASALSSTITAPMEFRHWWRWWTDGSVTGGDGELERCCEEE